MSNGTRHEIYGIVYDTSYDHALRLWTTLAKDGEGNQIGPAIYAATRDLALISAGLEGRRRPLVPLTYTHGEQEK